MRQIIKIITFIAAFALPSIAWSGCAGDFAACMVGEGQQAGEYHLVLPNAKAPEEGLPAVVFLHGWGSDGSAMLQNSAMVEAFTARGFAVIAPEGTPRHKRNGRQWLFHPNHSNGRDEIAFLQALADDAAARFGLNRERMILAGYSIGGSMVSYTACKSPDSFKAYAPVAGNLWRPYPQSCAAPVDLLHTHGWSDGTVPLEGRKIANDMVQGDVFHALSIWRKTNACQKHNPDQFTKRDNFLIRIWSDCGSDKSLQMALHPRGHVIPGGWAEMVLDWFETLPDVAG